MKTFPDTDQERYHPDPGEPRRCWTCDGLHDEQCRECGARCGEPHSGGCRKVLEAQLAGALLPVEMGIKAMERGQGKDQPRDATKGIVLDDKG